MPSRAAMTLIPVCWDSLWAISHGFAFHTPIPKWFRIAILGLIAAVAGPALFKYLERAKKSRAQQDLKGIQNAITLYQSDTKKLGKKECCIYVNMVRTHFNFVLSSVYESNGRNCSKWKKIGPEITVKDQ